MQKKKKKLVAMLLSADCCWKYVSNDVPPKVVWVELCKKRRKAIQHVSYTAFRAIQRICSHS